MRKLIASLIVGVWLFAGCAGSKTTAGNETAASAVTADNFSRAGSTSATMEQSDMLMQITPDSVYVGGRAIVSVSEVRAIPADDMDAVIHKLSGVLEALTKELGAATKTQITMAVDKDLEYDILIKIIYTFISADYSNVRITAVPMDGEHTVNASFPPKPTEEEETGIISGETRGRAVADALNPFNIQREKLWLTAMIFDTVITIGVKGGFLPSVFYRESENGNALHVFNETDGVFNVPYTKDGRLLTHGKDRYDIIKTVNVGDTLFTVTNPREMIVVKDADEFKYRPLSAYDQIMNRLMMIKARYGDENEYADPNDIIIVAENQVSIGKVLKVANVANVVGYPNVSFARFRD